MEKEMVDHPDHYKGNGNFECIDVMLDVYGAEATKNFCLLNAFKYLYRCNKKGKKNEDIKKAIWYLNEYNKISDNDSKKLLNNLKDLVIDDYIDFVKENKNILSTDDNSIANKNIKNILPTGLGCSDISIDNDIYKSIYKGLKEEIIKETYDKISIASAGRFCNIKLSLIHKLSNSSNLPNEISCTGYPCYFTLDKNGLNVNFICYLNLNDDKFTYVEASNLVWKATVYNNENKYTVDRVTIPTYEQITSKCSMINLKRDYWITTTDRSPSSNIFYVDKFGSIRQSNDKIDLAVKKSVIPFISLHVEF